MEHSLVMLAGMKGSKECVILPRGLINGRGGTRRVGRIRNTGLHTPRYSKLSPGC